MITLMALVLAAMPVAGGAPTLCRTVHGRMMATNGTPSLRIWEVGTRHYLGVDVAEDLSLKTLPANIRRKWLAAAPRGSLFDASLYGDFRVCAWKPRRNGEMEMVRVTSGHKLFAGPYS
jgi:hypothetical protein